LTFDDRPPALTMAAMIRTPIEVAQIIPPPIAQGPR
jgi:hypothetical protein